MKALHSSPTLHLLVHYHLLKECFAELGMKRATRFHQKPFNTLNYISSSRIHSLLLFLIQQQYGAQDRRRS